jgi:hypothetical protein
VGPVGGGEVTQSRAIDQRGDHLGGLGHLLEVGVVVANRDGGDLSVAVYEC